MTPFFFFGAFTVANLNDTDGDGVIDKDDPAVTATANGRNEIDLVKLVINKPHTGPDQLELSAYIIRLKLVSGQAALWTTSQKGPPFTLTNGQADIPASELPKTLYVEATAVSTALRDIEIKADFMKGSTVLRTDTVKVTGIWATASFRNSGTTLSPENTGAPINSVQEHFLKNGGALGMSLYLANFRNWPEDAPGAIKNLMEMQFTLQPAGIGNVSGIYYDVTRRAETQHYAYDSLTSAPSVYGSWLTLNPKAEVGNDDIGTDSRVDETNIPQNDHLYSFDAPGLIALSTSTKHRIISGINAQEFVRIRLIYSPLHIREKNWGRGRLDMPTGIQD